MATDDRAREWDEQDDGDPLEEIDDELKPDALDELGEEDDEAELDDDLEEDALDDAERLDAELPNEDDILVRRDYAEATRAGLPGSDTLIEAIQDPGTTPEVSAGDLDADWQRADPVGEETVGGSVPTPDQDIVDEVGKGAGLTYEDTEPLRPKVEERDRHRWELDPASSEDYVQRQEEVNSGEAEDDEGEDREKKKAA